MLKEARLQIVLVVPTKKMLQFYLGTADGAGTIVTKLILLPYERLPSPIVKVIPKDWDVGKTGSGWMTAEAFYKYIGR